MICFTSRNIWGRLVIHIQMLKHTKINSVSHIYIKNCRFVGWITLFFGWREITCEQEQFSEEKSLCFARRHVNLISKMALGVASHQCRGIKQLNTENRIQNFPVQQEKDSTKMKTFTSEKILQKICSGGSRSRTSLRRVSGRALKVYLQKQSW